MTACHAVSSSGIKEISARIARPPPDTFKVDGELPAIGAGLFVDPPQWWWGCPAALLRSLIAVEIEQAMSGASRISNF